jgi:hypothetical protein
MQTATNMTKCDPYSPSNKSNFLYKMWAEQTEGAKDFFFQKEDEPDVRYTPPHIRGVK